MDDDERIAGISMRGRVRSIVGICEAGELVDCNGLRHVPAWPKRGLARPAMRRALNIRPRP